MSDTWHDWPPSPDPIDLDDCFEVYDDAAIFAHLDAFNDCIDAGGHVWLAENGDVRAASTARSRQCR
jgi:hypothetical protein